VYLLWMFQKLFYGPNTNPANQRLRDLKPWEIALCATLVLFVFWGGFWPNTFLRPMENSIAATRMMASNPVGDRPTWSDEETSVTVDGHLIRNSPVASVLPFTIHHSPFTNTGARP